MTSAQWTDGHAFTATMLWCEEKYAYSVMIAEFWNTITDIPFVAIGLYYLFYCWRWKLKRRYLLCYFFYTIIGIGSFFFHATLRYEAQLFDELPMMLMAGQSIWCMVVNGHSSKIRSIISAVIVYSLIAVGASVYLIYRNYWVFYGIFVAIMTVLVLGAIYLSHTNPHVSSPMMKAFWVNLAAFGLWNIDVHLCSQLRFIRSCFVQPLDSILQLHGWWHLLTAIGLVWFVIGLIVAHPSGRRFHLRSFLGFLPVLTISSPSASKNDRASSARCK